MKNFSSVFFLMLLLIFLNVTHGRVLRSMDGVDSAAAAECDHDQQIEGADGSIGMTNFAVSSNHSSSNTNSFRETVRSLTTKLASGPSKKGPGH
ncbi:hypothetical protein ACH5RR_027131 [Cinchona calisaya]|uniref:Uncharacterized protein n=1 Tax=Cinchona calisaya TaxID=153742 RepID=A0ABD2Z5R0_9GENT